MASLALTVAGGLIGGPAGALVGSLLGNLLFPQKIQGPRLQDLHLHTSSYGKMTPILYGTDRIADNVIWIGNDGNLVEHEETSGGKGGPEVTNYTYSASFACRICEGPIQGISRIWANGRLIYSTEEPGDLPITIYLGTETQTADPTMEADLGAGNVPGYRGIAYVVFTDLFLTDYGNAIPNLEFEAFTKGQDTIPIVEEYLTTDNTNNAGHTSTLVLTQWTLHGGPQAIRASGRIVSTATTPTAIPDGVKTWDGDPTLAWNSVADSVISTDSWPQHIDTFGTDPTGDISGFQEISYYALGVLVNDDGTAVPLWAENFGGGPVIAGPDLDCSSYPAFGTDYYQVWGLPADHTFVTAIGTANNRSLFVMTQSSGGTQADHWFEIRGNKIVRQGTIAATLTISPDPLSTNRFGNTVARCFENNREWMWSFQANASGIGTSGGAVGVSRIDPTTLILDRYTAAGSCFIDALDPFSTSSSVPPDTPTLIAIGSGRAGVIFGNAVAIFRRVSNESGVPLSEIVADLSDRSGLDASQYDVSDLPDLVDGYLIEQQQSGRDDIQPLRNAYFFDAVERDGKVVFVKRNADSIVSIPADDLAAHADGEEAPPIVQTVRGQEEDLPAIVTVNYVNPAADYQTGSQTSQRLVTNSQSSVTLDLPISMSDQKAKSVADTQLLMAWVERNRHTFQASRKYAKYEPTDVVTADGHKLRVMEKSETRAGVIKFDGVAALAPVLIQQGLPVSGEGFTSVPSTPSIVGTTNLYLLDIPLVDDADDPNGVYAAISGNSPSWNGAAIYKSVDGGASYSLVFSTSTPSVIGETTTILGDYFGGNTFDESNTVTVTVGSGQTLSSATADAVRNGANKALVGAEIVQYRDATLTGADAYRLSGLLRGRRGTEWATGGHAIGERFVALPVHRISSPTSELNQLRYYKPVTLGGTVAGAAAQTFVNTGMALKPYAPVFVGGGSDASGNATLTWTRRTRIGGEWVPYVDVPLSEASEAYKVQIWNSTYTQVARIIDATTQSTTYTAAQQVADFGAAQQTIYFTVGQMGSIGIGTQARGSVPGAGASNGNPLSPISPYQSPTSGSSAPPPAANTLNMYLTWGAAGSGNVRANSTAVGAFACGSVLVVHFTTPASTADGQLGWIAAAESVAGPVQRTACLSTVAGDFATNALGSVVHNVSPTITFSVGSNSGGYPQLAPSTTYYFNVRNDDGHGVCTCMTSDCSVFVELSKPSGL